MSKLTVYHGSPVIIEKPQFGVGNPNNDYGLGFYCTETLDLAKEWACSTETDGYANKYTLDMSNLTVLSLTSGDYNILNWLAILLENRKFRIGGDVARQARDYISKNFGQASRMGFHRTQFPRSQLHSGGLRQRSCGAGYRGCRRVRQAQLQDRC